MNNRIYLDYAAATPLDPQVEKAMQPFRSDRFYNPGSLYLAAREVKTEVESARKRISSTIGAVPSEIVFTSGATESINLAIFGVAKKYPSSKILALATEHHAVLSCLNTLKDSHKIELIPVDAKGRIKLEQLEKLIDDQSVLVSVALANNETGTVQPIKEVTKIIGEVRKRRTGKLPIYFHTDASQAANYLPLNTDRLKIDLLSLGGSKIYGPHGSGLLYVRKGIELKPVIFGGGQEKGLRGGTLGADLVVGLAEALSMSQRTAKTETARLSKLRNIALNEIRKTKGVKINGDAKRSLPGFINISIEGTDGESLVFYLDEAGVQVSTGAACTIGQAKPSHVLLALGLSEVEANSNLRITLGRLTKQSDVEGLLKVLPEVVKRVRQLQSH